MATVRCPSCDRALEVEDAYRDWTVRCPHCGGEFVPDADGAERPSRRRREEPDDRDDFDEDDYARDEDRDEALRVVAGPAIALEILGWLGALGSVGAFALCIVLALEINNNRNANGDDAIPLVLIGGCAAVLGVPYSMAIGIGARKMRTLSSRGWAMTAGILSVAGFSIFGICGVIHAGIGAWALVALDNPAVRVAFGLPARRHPNP